MIQIEPSSIRRSLHASRRPLLVLIVVLLTGLPHMAAAWSDGTIYDEDHTLRSVGRVLLLDKSTSSRFTIATHATQSASGAPARLLFPVTYDGRASRAAVQTLPKPRPLLWSVMRVLYLHNSNYT